ncbi:hypothetical protein BT96DRAFT_943435 [Gymnopus androsaceus JB14]|uniref:Uncharacterized protein n=1 Tax=Gymnopus androsaceus JB14 TaxID=1447944 RepID=A0A6A4HA81_9AGAR|nr:hypothetical protein BT96DRAFT_943435 [Gymnopus androsaceus JB14]
MGAMGAMSAAQSCPALSSSPSSCQYSYFYLAPTNTAGILGIAATAADAPVQAQSQLQLSLLGGRRNHTVVIARESQRTRAATCNLSRKGFSRLRTLALYAMVTRF